MAPPWLPVLSPFKFRTRCRQALGEGYEHQGQQPRPTRQVVRASLHHRIKVGCESPPVRSSTPTTVFIFENIYQHYHHFFISKMAETLVNMAFLAAPMAQIRTTSRASTKSCSSRSTPSPRSTREWGQSRARWPASRNASGRSSAQRPAATPPPEPQRQAEISPLRTYCWQPRIAREGMVTKRVGLGQQPSETSGFGSDIQDGMTVIEPTTGQPKSAPHSLELPDGGPWNLPNSEHTSISNTKTSPPTSGSSMGRPSSETAASDSIRRAASRKFYGMQRPGNTMIVLHRAWGARATRSDAIFGALVGTSKSA